ncbi:ABC transporter ATP-binding protein [Shewanella gaetbuli]|uniref:ABC transporter ATP-binding protein n=1 Tax=Shewanella gaetbuli TaxID=220752 RepID=A0A9X1ZJS5_9GAMM|nr:ABC transporter ATP-binding protein [Shewanella gaetbuli]MCL1143033.1 ABC transporter ATP-binding protein [Shewanella gaetbuli]
MNLIECTQLSKNYSGKNVLNQVNISLKAGAPIALVGPNGAGKTTLFSIICGYISASSGSVKILGESPNSAKLRGRLSALPQDAQLDPDITIISQLMLFAQLQGLSKAAAKHEAMRVLELVDLAQVVHEKPKSLSHGMGKRVSIAQALIGTPDVVLLDEPTAGLDPANAKKVREIVRQQSASSTFIISSHNLDELEKLCDQVIYLENGSLKQSLSIQSKQNVEYLTLVMTETDMQALTNEVSSFEGVINVTTSTDKQMIIEYSHQHGFQLETQLLTLFAQHQWQYKSILKGRTLEDTLFS